MSRREGLSFQDAVQAAMVDIDSAESDVASPAVELTVDADTEGTEQPVVESDEPSGLFDEMFVEKQDDVNEKTSVSEDSLTFTVDGVQRTIAELKEGFMLKADYTRKTQELSALRKENENAVVLWKALQENPANTVKALWQRVAAGQPPVEVKPDEVDIEALVAQRVEEALANDPRIVSARRDEALNWATSELDAIASENSVVLNDADKIRVLERAQELETNDLRYAFYTLDQERRRLEAQRRNAEANSSVTGFQTTDEPIQPADKKYSSIREALEDSMREEGISRDTIFVT